MQVDYGKLAEVAGLKDRKSASTTWSMIKKKLMTNAGLATPASGKKRGAGAIDEEEGPDPTPSKKPARAKGKGKAKAKPKPKSAEFINEADEEGDGYDHDDMKDLDIAANAQIHAEERDAAKLKKQTQQAFEEEEEYGEI